MSYLRHKDVIEVVRYNYRTLGHSYGTYVQFAYEYPLSTISYVTGMFLL